MRSVNSFLLVIVFALLATGCRHNVPVAKNVPQTPPPQPVTPAASLSIRPDTVQSGQSAELTWSTKDATTVTIDGIGTVGASGSQKVTPRDSTTYHLLAKGSGGNAEASARITVNMPVTKATELTEEQLFAQNMKDIFFSYDSAAIGVDIQPTLSADLQFLVKHPEIKVVIEGHCDERGSTEYNMTLGESRAGGVKTALMNGGISADRIQMVSYGKERPFCTTVESESCWQQNRRAHFVFRGQERSSVK
jgi:peptidoglycan-associated lipoprotein